MRQDSESHEHESIDELGAILDYEDFIIDELEDMPQDVSRRVLAKLIFNELLLCGVRYEDAEIVRANLTHMLVGK